MKIDTERAPLEANEFRTPLLTEVAGRSVWAGRQSGA